MYHHLGDSKNPMFRSVAAFKNDLDRLDKMGFRPVTASEWLGGKMNLPAGASPAVMTFDDSNPDQFRLKEDGALDPNCMMGLWSTFAKTHPEFPIRATFFVLPDVMFGQPHMVRTKLDLLKKWGCEVANHTVHHLTLRKCSDAKVMQEIGVAAKLLGDGTAPLALPNGSSPTNKALLKGFDWQGMRVQPSGVFLVGAEPAPSIEDGKFNRYAVPRIQANDGELGLTFWLDRLAEGKVQVYVQ